MSVIIKGLNKFHSCRLCLFNNSDCYCNITKGKIDRDDYSCEYECPIVQLPKKHGDLIDRDHIIARLETASKFFGGEHTDAFDERFSQGLKEAAIKVAEEPTVVEADKGE